MRSVLHLEEHTKGALKKRRPERGVVGTFKKGSILQDWVPPSLSACVPATPWRPPGSGFWSASLPPAARSC